MKLLFVLVSVFYVIEDITHGCMMAPPTVPEVYYNYSDFVIKAFVVSKAQGHLLPDGRFLEDTNEEIVDDEEDDGSEESNTIVIENDSTFSGDGDNEQPSEDDAGPDEGPGGSEISWPRRLISSASGRTRSNSQPSSLRGPVLRYTDRGPQNAMPGRPEHFSGINSGGLRSAGGPTPIPLSSNNDIANEQPPEAGAGPDESGGVALSWDAIRGRWVPRRATTHRRTTKRSATRHNRYYGHGSEGAIPGRSEDFAGLDLAGFSLERIPIPIPIENQNDENEQPSEVGEESAPDGVEISWPGVRGSYLIGEIRNDKENRRNKLHRSRSINRYTDHGADGAIPGHMEDFAGINSAGLSLEKVPIPIPMEDKDTASRKRRSHKRHNRSASKKIRKNLSRNKPVNSASSSSEDEPLGNPMTQYTIRIIKVYKGDVSTATQHLYTPPTGNLCATSLVLNTSYVIMGSLPVLPNKKLFIDMASYRFIVDGFNSLELRDLDTTLERRFPNGIKRPRGCSVAVCFNDCPEGENLCLWRNVDGLSNPRAIQFGCRKRKRAGCAWKNFVNPHMNINQL